MILAWLGSSWAHNSLTGLLLAAIALIGVVWQPWFRTSAQSVPRPMPTTLTWAQVQQALQATTQVLEMLAEEAPARASGWQAALGHLGQDAQRQQLRIGLMGEAGVGKSTLLAGLTHQWLPGLSRPCELIESACPREGDIIVKTALQSAKGLPDIILFLTTGDLADAAYQQLTTLQGQRQRLVVVLTQIDRLLPGQMERLQQHLQERLPFAVNIIPIAVQPQPVKVRRHQVSGAVTEIWETPEPILQPLITHLNQVVQTDAEQLIWQQTYRQTRVLQQGLWGTLHQVRRDRALPLIERYQWISAATLFANPLPALDLLATSVITTKLILELGTLYRQRLSLAQAQGLATVMAKLLIQLGIVELSTQTLMGFFKSNSLTFVAGGLCQGASAAYLTRIAGLSLIEHFQILSEQETARVGCSTQGLEPIMRRVFESHQKLDLLKDLAQQTLKRLRPVLPHLDGHEPDTSTPSA